MTNDNNRIAKNTIVLYIRMLMVMFINLYAVRLVINALGVEDYGIYNVIAGVVTSLSCITNVLSASTQRFYSVAQGKGDVKNLQEIFSNSLRIILVVVIILLLFAETFGLWFINTKLVIPDNRLMAANFVYQAALISFAFAFIQSPYSAAIIAHEDMGFFAVITLGDCVLKFIVAAVLFFINGDNLIIYSILLSIISVFIALAYYIICKRNYRECIYSSKKNKSLRNQILSFSGWTLLTACAGICMYQANTILVNLYYGPIVNASRGIALQLNASLSSFTGSFLVAIRPPIMKLYAEKKYQELNQLFTISNKFIFYLMLMISLPLLLEMGTVLKLWLNQNDEQTVLFSRLIVIYGLILSLNNPISYIVQATGKVKQYCIYVEIFTILCMPATLFAFELGYEASSTFVIMIGCVIFSHIARLVCLKKSYPQIDLCDYFVNFLARACVVSIIVAITVYLVHIQINSLSTRLLLIVIASVASSIFWGYIIGLSRLEKSSVKRKFNKYINRYEW